MLADGIPFYSVAELQRVVKYCRCSNALCKRPLPFAIGAIATIAQNGSDSKVRQVTCTAVVAPAVLTAPVALLLLLPTLISYLGWLHGNLPMINIINIIHKFT